MKKPVRPAPTPASGRRAEEPAAPPERQPSRDGRKRRPGRPRLTPEELQARVAAYCLRHGVTLQDGFPPFPSGRRESAQHREWMALYKADQRLRAYESSAATTLGDADRARLPELLAAQGGRCAICRKPLGLSEARIDPANESQPIPASALHAGCFELVELARALGAEALDRARARI